MTLHRITLLTSCFSILLASACDLGDKSVGNDTAADEGETGDPGEDEGDDSNQAEFGDCGEETVSVVADPNAALPGFDGVVTDYLALIEGSFVGTFTWGPDDGLVSIEHAGTESPLTMTVSYDGGEVRLVEVELVGQPPEGGLEGDFGVCSNVLEIDVTLSFATEDGVFAEAFQIPIRLASHVEGNAPSFYFSLDMAALQGTLALDDFSVEDGWSVSDLVMTGDFAADVVHGSLNMEVMSTDVVGFGGIAQFDAARQ